MASATGPITVGELSEIFGGEMPLEALCIIYPEAFGYERTERTDDELRAELRQLIAVSAAPNRPRLRAVR